jgi:hypothetical protein
MTNRYWSIRRYLIAMNLVCALLAAVPALGQQQPSPANAPPENQSTTPQQSTGDKDDKDKPSNAVTNDRLFGVLPNYFTVENAGNIPPLSAGTKYKLAAKGSFDVAEFAFVGFVALIGQANNSDSSYGQGMSGYGKRYGEAFANQAIGNVMVGGVFPSFLHQDPRYYQLGKGRFVHRAKYAVDRIFITRTDSGHRQFNYSEFAGNAVTAGISNIYAPSNERSVSDTLTTWGMQIMWDTAGNEAKEFWPDIRRWIRKK